ncbi:MAG: prepilin peptidase [Candidatus Bathyarchaeota archaeon]|nr:prepilin peptidase [Candidatus Bathyarchaeota archaeon]
MNYAAATITLAAAAVYDVKTREVPDKIWMTALPASAAITAAAYINNELHWLSIAVSLALAAALSLAFAYFGLFGGADVKALIYVAIAVPAYPAGLPLLPDPARTPAFTIICNAALISIIYPLRIFISNLHKMLRKQNPYQNIQIKPRDAFIMLFTSTRVPIEKLSLKNFPAERLENINGVKTRIAVPFTRAEADITSTIETIKAHSTLYVDGVLATPTIPFILPLLAATIIAVAGNIMIMLLQLLL